MGASVDRIFIFGFGFVALDLALWRARLPTNELARLVIRLILFAALSYVLFASGLSPFTQAPMPRSTSLYWLGQLIELIWWLWGARVLTLSLDGLLLPRAWRRQRLFSDVFGAVVFLAAAVAALGFVLELPIRGLVATSGALAIVLGLAIQSTLSDVFAGIVLNTTEPYSVGDWVKIDDVEGQVIEMNWRATHLLTSQGNTLIVPNAVASKTKIFNNSKPANLHGISLILEIDPAARPKIVLDALGRALTGCNGILDTPAPYAGLKRTSPDSVQYEVVAFVSSMSAKFSTTNALFDLCYRHLVASGIRPRVLGVAAAASSHPNEKAALLRTVGLFESLTHDEVEKLAERLTRHEFHATQLVVSSETIPEQLSIIASGVLSVTFHDSTGDREIARAGPGETFGEAGVLAGLPMRVSVSALTPVVLFQLTKDDMTVFLKAHPEVARKLCQLLTSRQDILKTAMIPVQAEQQEGHSLFHWLFNKVRHMHALHDHD
jgi:small-conductance mechanosensitive channel